MPTNQIINTQKIINYSWWSKTYKYIIPYSHEIKKLAHEVHHAKTYKVSMIRFPSSVGWRGEGVGAQSMAQEYATHVLKRRTRSLLTPCACGTKHQLGAPTSSLFCAHKEIKWCFLVNVWGMRRGLSINLRKLENCKWCLAFSIQAREFHEWWLLIYLFLQLYKL